MIASKSVSFDAHRGSFFHLPSLLPLSTLFLSSLCLLFFLLPSSFSFVSSLSLCLSALLSVLVASPLAAAAATDSLVQQARALMMGYGNSTLNTAKGGEKNDDDEFVPVINAL